METQTHRSSSDKYLAGAKFNSVNNALLKSGTIDALITYNRDINVIYVDSDPELKKRRYCSLFGLRPELVTACKSFFCPWCKARKIYKIMVSTSRAIRKAGSSIEWLVSASSTDLYDPIRDRFLRWDDEEMEPTDFAYSEPEDQLRVARRLHDFVQSTHVNDFNRFRERFGVPRPWERRKAKTGLILGRSIIQDIFFDRTMEMFAVNRVTFIAGNGEFKFSALASSVDPYSPSVRMTREVLESGERLIIPSLTINWLPTRQMSRGQLETARLIDVRGPHQLRRVRCTSRKGIFWGA